MVSKHVVLISVALAAGSFTFAQQAAPDSSGVIAWQRHYKDEFLTDPRSPLKAADTADLRFYGFNAGFRFHVRLRKTPHAEPVQMATHSGKIKNFRPYGTVRIGPVRDGADFGGARTTYTLTLYQSLDRPDDSTLFLPFYDRTNGQETYGGGRYLDLKRSDFDGRGHGVIDFNEAYNPWCAYKEGYNCPIPPEANRLSRLQVRAGEKRFAKAPPEP